MDMVQFTFPLTEEQKKAKEAKVKLLLKNPMIQKWKQTYQVDDAFIAAHSGRFQDYCDTLEKCKQCQGLDFCRQADQGNRLELVLDGMLQTIVVPCRYQQQKNEQFAHARKYKQIDMPQDYLCVDISTLNMEQESNDYKMVVMQVMQLLMNENANKGFYLWGKPGAGKSYLAAGICNYYAKANHHVSFVNVPKLISDLKMMFHDSLAMEEKINSICNVEILVLDDIGGESVTAWSRDDILLPILDRRMEKKKLTFFTSNYRMKELKEKLALANGKQVEPMAAERILERISTLSCEIFIKGNSRRK